MNWKVKAAIQNAIAALPRQVSYAAYFRMQRLFGGFRSLEPLEHFSAGIAIWRRVLQHGSIPTDKTFFEVGTGHTPIVPLAFWLMGARRTITVDVNPYLKVELVRECLGYVEANQARVIALFGELLHRNRLEELLRFYRRGAFSLKQFLDLCCIDYIEPGDAARTALPPKSIDIHTSYTVFEHIPPGVLQQILEEGLRIVRDDGLFVHMVDYSDHFSHSDPTISAINFLQYSNTEWARYADNRYMYMNRLRHDDTVALFEAAGHEILATTPTVDEVCKEILSAGRLPLNERFSVKTQETLSIRDSWFVSRRRRPERIGVEAEPQAVAGRPVPLL